VPISNCADIGVRGIVSGSRADEVISSLATVEIEMTANWNKRYRENVLRIKSGDLDEVVKVVKGLTVRDLQHGLSTGERKMLHSAKDILISEIVLAKGLTYDAIEHEIDTAMASGMEA
ncbi:MAG: CarD family transcriptional regulator, partial [Clostridia bacterium]